MMRAARLYARGFIAALSAVVILFAFFGKTYAQTNYLNLNTNPNVVQNQHTFVQAVAIEALATGICFLSGYDILSPTHQCLGIDPYTNKLGYAPSPLNNNGRPVAGGVLGSVSYMIGDLYKVQPASGIGYVRYMAGNFGFGEKAYAQAGGGGYENLYELRFLWQNMRNLAYAVMVIAFIIVGIAIMLRVRIDPRTVMTVQNQIPKIIIGILLITFSYAIAGFMVDLMWFTTYFGINAVAGTNDDTKKIVDHVVDNPVYFLNSVFHYDIQKPDGTTDHREGIWDMSTSIGDSLATIVVYNFIGGGTCVSGGGISFDPSWKDAVWAIPFIGPVAGAITGNVPLVDVSTPHIDLGACLDGILHWIGKYIFTFIVLAAMLIALVKLWFILLKALAFIILDVIAAPLWIAAGAIPGSSLNFSSWFKHLTAHLLLFPAAVVLIVLARTLQEAAFRNQLIPDQGLNVKNFLTPPLLGNPGAPEAFINIIVFAIIMMIPEMLTVLRDALRSKPLPYTAAIGAGAMTGAAGAGSIAGIPMGGFRAYKSASSVTTTGVGAGGAPQYGPRGWVRTLTKSG